MEISRFLEELKELRLYLALENGKLVLKGNRNELDAATAQERKRIIDLIAAHKDELIGYLAGKEPVSGTVSGGKKPVEISSMYRLSSLQEGMLFHELYDKTSTAYTMQMGCNFTGLDVAVFRACWQKLIKEHSILRTGFFPDRFSIPVQCVYQEAVVPIEELDYRDIPVHRQAAEIAAREEADRVKGFDLERPPLMRVTLCRLDDAAWRMIWTWHHLLLDGWSGPVLIEKFLNNYEALVKGEAPPAGAEDRYEDFIRFTEQRDKDAEEDYWRHYLGELRQGTLLPYIGSRSPDRTRKEAGLYARTWLHFDRERAERIAAYCRRYRITVNTLIQGAWAYLLYRYTGSRDVVYGVTVSGRPDELKDVEHRVGMYINTLPLFTRIPEHTAASAWLQELQQEQMQSRTFQYASLSDIQGWAGIKGELFDSILVFENYPISKVLDSGTWSLRAKELTSYDQNNYPLTIAVEAGEEIDIFFDHNNLLDDFYAAQMRDHFGNVLWQLIDAGDGPVPKMELMTPAEKELLLKLSAGAKKEYAAPATIIELFERQMELTPDAQAVLYEDSSLTYRELDERANQLGHYLRAKGVEPETAVPICIERGIGMIVCILGVLKAGAAYVPVDPAYPQNRIDRLLDDIGASVIIASGTCSRLISRGDAVLILPDQEDELIGMAGKSRPGRHLNSNSLAYIIYTSGSTGLPKGVLIEHGGVVNMVMNHIEYIGLRPGLRILQFASFAFDGSCQEIFNTLCSGGTLVMMNNEQVLSASLLADLIQRAGVDMATLPPSYQQAVKEDLHGLKILYSAGEALQPAVGEYLVRKGIRLLNGYGPTENTVTATLTDEPIRKDGHVVIGKPLNNVQIYIADPAGRLLPQGIPGELYLGGIQVARGYLKRPELDAEKFIPDGFGGASGDIGATGASGVRGGRLYKTGDLGRWLPDGNIELLGRADEQIKIRGYRVEPGEIEHTICLAPKVMQAAVVLREDQPGIKQLAAFIVSRGQLDRHAVGVWLKERLPAYMVPAILVQLEELPLTPNGKVDRKRLQTIELPGMSSAEAATAPRSKMEDILLSIWRELLGNEQLGIHDNFFEAGGDSIIAIQIASRFRRAGFQLELQQLFTYQTIAKLSEALGGGKHTGRTVSSEQGILTGTAGLLPIQQWYFEQVHNADSFYNQSVLLQISKSLDPGAIARAIETLTLQHDSLRFLYYQIQSGWTQEYGGLPARLHTVDLSSVAAPRLTQQLTLICTDYQQQVDIHEGKLMQAVLFQMPDSEVDNRLLLTVHHLAIDGVSWRILLSDLELLLSGASAGEKSCSYREWYNALQKYGQTKRLQSQRNYWVDIIRRYTPLATDHSFAGLIRANDIRHCPARLNAGLTRSLLQEIPRVYNTEINDVLLTALARAVTKLYSREQVIVGLEGHGREDAVTGLDSSRTVGWFTSVYPMLLELAPSLSLGDSIKQVKEQLRAVPDKGVGFGVLRYINKEAAFQRQHCWNIGFNYLGQADNVLSGSRFFRAATESAGASLSENIRQHERLFVNCLVRDGELQMEWGYSGRHYLPETIARLAQAYILELTALVEHCVEKGKAGVFRTPADYGLTREIGWQELDDFLNAPLGPDRIPRRELMQGMCRLSALQEGMMFHSLLNNVTGDYVMQLTYEFTGLDIACFKESWKPVLRHHSILRSGFYEKAFAIPVQCVYRNVSIPIEERDLRFMPEDEMTRTALSLEEANRVKGFDLGQPPLMRFTLLRIADSRYRMIWTYHHLLFDGWSGSVLIAEFLQTYLALLAGAELPVVEEDRYEDYIRYLEKRDLEQEEAYWRHYLRGFGKGTYLAVTAGSIPEAGRTDNGDHPEEILSLDRLTTIRLEAFAQQSRITINTIFQGIWAYLLHRYTGSADVVFGVTVSGRPDDLPGIEQRIGTYINTIPLRAEIKSERKIIDWLQEIQQDQIRSRTWQYASLNDIRRWAGVREQLFDHIMVFENYPMNKMPASGETGVTTEIIASHERNNYSLSISVMTGETITILFKYDPAVYHGADVCTMVHHFGEVLQTVIGDEEKRIGDLDDDTSSDGAQEAAQAASEDLFDFSKLS